MQSSSVYHGQLEKKTSYVLRGNIICIVGPSINGVGKDEEEKMRLQEIDISGFRQFLKDILITQFNSVDLDLFYQLCDYKPINIKFLQNHPVLKGPDERLMYFEHWYDCCVPRWNYPQEEIEHFWANLESLLKHFMPWDLKLKGVYLIYYNNPPPDTTLNHGTELKDLMRFIRYSKRYLRETDAKKMLEIDRDLEEMFPGLISLLHECSATLNSRCS